MKLARRVLPALGAILLLSTFAAPPANAQTGESSLNAWSLDGQLLVEGSATQVTPLQSLPCAAIHDAIGDYNDAEAWVEDPTYATWVSVINTTEFQFESLARYFGSLDNRGVNFDYSEFALVFCTKVHGDGWQPATTQVLGWVDGGSPWVQVTQSGPLACFNPGQVLMVKSGYFFWQGEWNSFYGTDWIEDFTGGGFPTVTGIFEMVCMDLIPGGASDFLDVGQAVPTAQVNYNPTVTGLTGLATWLWYDFTVQESYLLELDTQLIDARGTTWALDMVAWVDRVSWDVDCETVCDYRGTEVGFDASGYDYTLDLEDSFDLSTEPAVLAPADVYDGGAPSDTDAAASHLYRTKGDYILSTATVWHGYYDLFGVLYTYQPVVVADSVDYQVIEVRSRLVTPVP